MEIPGISIGDLVQNSPCVAETQARSCRAPGWGQEDVPVFWMPRWRV